MSQVLSRRNFLADICFKKAPLLMLGGLVPPPPRQRRSSSAASDLVDNRHIFFLKEAAAYKKLEHKDIRCELCPKKCMVGDRERGYCGNRENREGTYYTLVYGNPCAVHVDPIEKKPLFHFLPATSAFSISTAGCNFHCKFCQNWEISQFRPEQVNNVRMPPGDVVDQAKGTGCASIAYTYAEPVVFYEYMYDTSVLAKQKGVRTVMISNGYIMPGPMRELCGHLSAVKVDFKAYTEKFYREACDGTLKPVLEVLELLRDIGIWYELVYLVVPTLNDKRSEIRDMSVWIRDTLGTHVPIHFTRFHPQYLLKNLPPTPVSTLDMARETAMAVGLEYVYVGNVPRHPGESTYCPNCRKRIIGRQGYWVLENNIVGGRCRFCGRSIPGVWS